MTLQQAAEYLWGQIPASDLFLYIFMLLLAILLLPSVVALTFYGIMYLVVFCRESGRRQGRSGAKSDS